MWCIKWCCFQQQILEMFPMLSHWKSILRLSWFMNTNKSKHITISCLIFTKSQALEFEMTIHPRLHRSMYNLTHTLKHTHTTAQPSRCFLSVFPIPNSFSHKGIKDSMLNRSREGSYCDINSSLPNATTGWAESVVCDVIIGIALWRKHDRLSLWGNQFMAKWNRCWKIYTCNFVRRNLIYIYSHALMIK